MRRGHQPAAPTFVKLIVPPRVTVDGVNGYGPSAPERPAVAPPLPAAPAPPTPPTPAEPPRSGPVPPADAPETRPWLAEPGPAVPELAPEPSPRRWPAFVPHASTTTAVPKHASLEKYERDRRRIIARARSAKSWPSFAKREASFSARG